MRNSDKYNQSSSGYSYKTFHFISDLIKQRSKFLSPNDGTRTLLHNITDLENFTPTNEEELVLKTALIYFKKNNHLFKKFEDSYNIYLHQKIIDKEKFTLQMKNNFYSKQMENEQGAFNPIDDPHTCIENINDCVEGFVISKNPKENNIPV